MNDLIELHLNGDKSSNPEIVRFLSLAFTKNENLKSVKLYNFEYLTGECFNSLNDSNIRVLEFKFTSQINRDLLTRSFQNFLLKHFFTQVTFNNL